MDPPIDPPTMSDGELIQQLEAKVEELRQKLANSNFFMDCHKTGERGADFCEFEGTHVCTVCHNADLEVRVKRLQVELKRAYFCLGLDYDGEWEVGERRRPLDGLVTEVVSQLVRARL